MTFFQKAGRFFEPLGDYKFLTFLSCLKFSTWGIHAIASVVIMRSSLKAIEQGNRELFQQNIQLYLFFIVLYFSVWWLLRATDWPGLFHSIERWIYQRYIPKLILLDNNYIEGIGTGKMISIIRDGRTVWVDQLSNFLKEITKLCITGGFLFYLVLLVSVWYLVAIVCALILLHILIIYMDTFAHRERRMRTREKWELTRKLVKIVMTKNEILQNQFIDKELMWLMDSVDVIDGINNRLNRSLFFLFNAVRVFAFSLRIWVLVIIGYGVFRGNYTLTDFATIMTMIIVFESFLFDSTEFYKNFTKDFSDIEELWRVIDAGPVMKGYDSGHTFSSHKKDIEINTISYGYNDTKVFTDFSLTIARGKKTALVGESGWGKTTLLKLIAGYLHPDEGSISVLGNTLSETALKTYYHHIGYLTQEPSVFDATIRENLLSAMQIYKKEDTEGKTSPLVGETERGTSSRPFIEEENKKTSTSFSLWESHSQDKLLHNALKLAHCDFVFEMKDGDLIPRLEKGEWGSPEVRSNDLL